MAQIDGEKDLNAAIPEALWDALDAISGEFRPFKKKHIVAAALTTFLRMTSQQRYDAIAAAEQAYYRKVVPSEAGEIAASAAGGAVSEECRKAKPKQRSTKGRG